MSRVLSTLFAIVVGASVTVFVAVAGLEGLHTKNSFVTLAVVVVAIALGSCLSVHLRRRSKIDRNRP